MLIDRLARYLHDTLNITVYTRKWEQFTSLPYFLQDNYVYYLAKIYGLELLLMVEAGDEEYSPAAIQKHMKQVKDRWQGEVAYVREQVSSFERKRLVEAGIPFIVPGNQLYLPMLALDLREYFRRPKLKNIQLFSPATQVLAIYLIYNSPDSVLADRRTPTEMAKILGYSKMTMSRGFKEIESALDAVNPDDKYGVVRKYDIPKREFWQQLQPYWRNPIKRRNYLFKHNRADKVGLKGGLTALANYSMLAEPKRDVYSVGQNEWKILQQNRDVMFLDRPAPDAVEMEIWAYQPELLASYGKKGTVDPLSLYLSLKENSDERIEMALEELLGAIQ